MLSATTIGWPGWLKSGAPAYATSRWYAVYAMKAKAQQNLQLKPLYLDVQATTPMV